MLIGQKPTKLKTGASENMRESVVVKGAAMWASLHEVNKMSDKYQIDICNLDKKDVTALEGFGIPVHKGEGEKKEKGRYVTAKTKLLPKVMDSAKNPWPSGTVVGNGSTVKCSISPYTWQYQKKSGISASLNAVMVVDFKPFTGNDDLDIEDGFILGDTDFVDDDDDDEDDL